MPLRARPGRVAACAMTPEKVRTYRDGRAPLRLCTPSRPCSASMSREGLADSTAFVFEQHPRFLGELSSKPLYAAFHRRVSKARDRDRQGSINHQLAHSRLHNRRHGHEVERWLRLCRGKGCKQREHAYHEWCSHSHHRKQHSDS